MGKDRERAISQTTPTELRAPAPREAGSSAQERPASHTSLLRQPLFCLTVPKSGTHLLGNILRALMGPDQVFADMLSEQHLLRREFTIAPLIYVGHVPYSLDCSRRLAAGAKILLCRDPRDLVVSYADALYNATVPPDSMTRFVATHGVGVAEALGVMIMGGGAGSAVYPSCQELFAKYLLQWLPQASLVVRYEDLFPVEDDWSRPVSAVRCVLEVLGLGASEERIRAALLEGSDPARSPTFHRGQIGRWREAFAPAHVIQFRSVAPNLVSLLGYEKDEQWGITDAGAWRPASSSLAGDLQVAATGTGAAAGANAAGSASASATDTVAHRQLVREIESIREVLKRQRDLNEQVHLRVSFLQANDFGLFCWTDDSLHCSTEQIFWDHGEYVRFIQDTRMHPSPEVARAEPEYPGAPVLHRVIRPVLARGHRVRFLDVGCCYGQQSILLSSMLSDFGEAFGITAFDCGWAGKLAPFNFEINGHKDRITFDPRAVTCHNRTSIVYGKYGSLENCRTVNRDVVAETFSCPCESTTIDSYVQEKGIDEPLLLEVDVHGGEYHALLGAQRALREQCYGVLLRFAPYALQTSVDPACLLAAVPGEYRLFAVAEGEPYEGREIVREQFPEFAAEAWRSPLDWTYLLILFTRYYRALGP